MPKLTDEAINSRKSHIIECAFQVFSEKGFSDTSMDDIVIKSGVSKGGIYNYFKSKEEIFLEIAESRLESRRSLMDSIPVNSGIHIFLRNYFTAVLLSLKDERNLMTARFSFEFWATVSRNAELNEKAQSRYSKFHSDLIRILKLGVKRGDLSSQLDLDNMGYVILATLDGMMHTHAIMGVEMTDESARHYVDMLMSKLEGRN
ncbi:MAG: TetR/AcrR family transcriptional regulator [Clostridiales bacterium]|jgi:AcrR family transcriptional regulator|nr:TetR/AcrR family transcriptional regulator [Clostridiales bacterium]MDW7662535.1 TetR/AcrR family transcriptional regulator [Bacillota bacterium]